MRLAQTLDHRTRIVPTAHPARLSDLFIALLMARVAQRHIH